ncbi:hypothetical protein BaRGS_00036168 [Batillaria attramentaria]|uniref:Uncharacterized protein n=1 Tax=Batillaria attramentaria TaxID=370345 RepID=A0ABD0JCE7_9CAEN
MAGTGILCRTFRTWRELESSVGRSGHGGNWNLVSDVQDMADMAGTGILCRTFRTWRELESSVGRSGHGGNWNLVSDVQDMAGTGI